MIYLQLIEYPQVPSTEAKSFSYVLILICRTILWKKNWGLKEVINWISVTQLRNDWDRVLSILNEPKSVRSKAVNNFHKKLEH